MKQHPISLQRLKRQTLWSQQTVSMSKLLACFCYLSQISSMDSNTEMKKILLRLAIRPAKTWKIKAIKLVWYIKLYYQLDLIKSTVKWVSMVVDIHSFLPQLYHNYILLMYLICWTITIWPEMFYYGFQNLTAHNRIPSLNNLQILEGSQYSWPIMKITRNLRIHIWGSTFIWV